MNAGGGTPVTSSGIVGVASSNEGESIKVYNGRQKYDEWEFIAILGQRGQQGQQAQPGQNNQQNPQANPGQLPPNSPFQNAPSFGGTPTGSPFNPGRGQQQNPFGNGNTGQQGMPQQGFPPSSQQPRR